MLIRHRDHAQQAFRVGLDTQYHPTKDDIYLITRLSRMGKDWPQFPELPTSITEETQLIYGQRYVSPDMV